MKIIHDSSTEYTSLAYLPAGDVFIPSVGTDRVFITTDMKRNGDILCVNLKTGAAIFFDEAMPVHEVEAEVHTA